MQGAWIEINSWERRGRCRRCRSPCRERGLKSFSWPFSAFRDVSLPVQGAWIEINSNYRQDLSVAPSLPVQGAWIEIIAKYAMPQYVDVAPRAGSVD